MANFAIQLAIGIGGYLLQQMFAPKPKDIVGPRLSDLNVASVSPGQPINRVWGTMKVPAQVLYLSRLREIKHVEKVGGGKGMGGKSQKQVTYTYEIDCAFGVCRGPVKRIRYIRANQKILWVNPEIRDELEQDFDEAYVSETRRLVELGVDPNEAHVSGFFFAYNYYSLDEYDLGTEADAKTYIMGHPVDGAILDEAYVTQLLAMMLDPLDEDAEYEKYKKRFDSIHIHLGTESQTPDSIIEADKGVGNVPAFRGLCYFVLDTLQLEDFGNAIPTFQIEVEEDDGVFLHEIINEVCLEAGMKKNEFSTSCNMPAINVNGFAVTQQRTGRDIIGDLQQVYPFDATETEFKLRFNWLKKRPQAIIRWEDVGAHNFDEDRPPSLEVTRAQSDDFPIKRNFTYQEPERNYSTNTVHAQRYITDGNLEENANITISMGREEAKRWNLEQFVLKFMSRRTYKILVPAKYAILDATDVVLLEDRVEAGTYKAYRVLKTEIGANKVVSVEMCDYLYSEDFDLPSDNVVAEDPGDIATGSVTYAFLYDTPLLTDTQTDNTGFYALIAGARAGWSGGTLAVDLASSGSADAFGVTNTSGDSGSNWVTVASNDLAILNGFCMNKLATGTMLIRDWESYIVASFTNRSAALYSYDEDTLLTNPYNLVFVGNELIQYAHAEDLGNGMWKLTGLMRGLRGTDYYMSRHAAGERLVKVRYEAMQWVAHDDTYLDQVGKYRAYGFDGSVEDVSTFLFTNTGKSKYPWSPLLRYSDRVSDNLYLSWLPRARLSGNLQDGIEVGNGQPFDKYVVEVLDESDDVVRTVALTSTREWTYTSAMQVSDFGSAQSEVRLNVYQVGSMYGEERRGFPLELRL